ncbi:MAG TPA: bifunctional 4-hydroxy-2-oxoglutarate aldolase/2-dehydro-3-deoxy-phosphogluconate aldolase [Candidatus Acidoferrales bacterium]|jgi:2-dehydro-3-deoxyphosphogluconate aldolase/(4S)-4-hydroxy-2-oxoglutarate aldolase|nr:bifunctional 4-hydroxy-2-oxoglutarate aldolase/2-dehydro-3-deoxy-phosphogluconate aldolase [Candidatus Acidoferrales bacterium]
MNKDTALKRALATGIIPVIRAATPEDALFAAEAVLAGGINVAEITMTVPGATNVVSRLAKEMPEILVGAGTVLNADAAQRCLDAGAQFLVSPGLNLKTLEYAQKQNVLMIAGALTPTEVLSAWENGADLVKIFPCSQVGGASYIRALKGPFPEIPLVPTGGVNLDTCADFIAAGASALGVGGELILKEAIRHRNAAAISELAKQLLEAVQAARAKN